MNILDTGIIVELLREKRHEAGAISIITLIEVLRGIEVDKRAKVKELLEESFTTVHMDNRVIETYCSLYQRLREEGTVVPDADLLIAATAMSRSMNLKTRDKHFERLKNIGLKIIQTSKAQEGSQ